VGVLVGDRVGLAPPSSVGVGFVNEVVGNGVGAGVG